MDAQIVIMVQINGRRWTLEALHCACLLARRISAKIALVKMIPDQYYSSIGIDLGFLNFSEQDRSELSDYQATIEDYGVEYSIHFYYYVTLAWAIGQAAEHVNAQIVFATLPRSITPFWRSFQLQGLRRYLSRQQRELNEQPAYDLHSLLSPDPIKRQNGFCDREDV
jgi:hypothetical protein